MVVRVEQVSSRSSKYVRKELWALFYSLAFPLKLTIVEIRGYYLCIVYIPYQPSKLGPLYV